MILEDESKYYEKIEYLHFYNHSKLTKTVYTSKRSNDIEQKLNEIKEIIIRKIDYYDTIENKLSGETYESCAIGGILFSITALKDLKITGMSIVIRDTGTPSIRVLVKKGMMTCDIGKESDYQTLLLSTKFDFYDHKNPKRILNCDLEISSNEVYTFVILNQTDNISLEIVAKSKSSNTTFSTENSHIKNVGLATTYVYFLDRKIGTFQLYGYPNTLYKSIFIGEIFYKLK